MTSTTRFGIKRFLPLLVLLLVGASQVLHAQQGRFFLRHYAPELLNVDHQNYAIAQDEYGLLCFANRKGVLKFNGVEWWLVKTPSSALTLVQNKQDGQLYVGCRNGFGYISRNETGHDVYVSISDSLLLDEGVSHIEVIGNWVYFLSETDLYEYSSVEKRITNSYKAEDDISYFSLFQHQQQAYLFTEEEELLQAYANKLKPLETQVPDNHYPVFSVNISKRKSLVGTTDGVVYMLENERFTPVKLEDEAYLKGHNLLNGLLLQDSLLALSTLSGGVMIVNWQTGETVETVDYESGLPDNEVYAIFKDLKDNLWIAHEYGISVLDFNSPISVYSNYYGLKGSILTVSETADMLYVGTSVGLFYFDKIEDVTEIQRLVEEQLEESRPIVLGNKIQKIQKKAKVKASTKQGKKSTTEAEKNKSPWLKRLFSKRDGKKRKKKKNRKTKAQEAAEEEVKVPKEEEIIVEEEVVPVDSIEKETIHGEDPPITTTKATEKKAYRVEKVQVTNRVYYVFKQLEEIEGKCQQLIFYPNGVLAITNAGMFAVSGKRVTTITDEPIRLAYFSEKFQRVYASTYTDELLVFKQEGSRWKQEPIFTNFDHYISAFLEDELGNLWLCGNDYVMKFLLDENGAFSSMQEYEISNPFNDDIRAVAWKDKIYFLLSTGAYFYNGETLVLDKELIKQGEASKILSNTHEISWLHNGRDWVMLSGKNTAHISTSMKLNYLKWLGDLSGIFVGAKHDLWAVTKENELFRIDLNDKKRVSTGYELYLKSVRNHQDKFLELENFKVDRIDNHSLSFSFAVPSYFEKGHTDYQYRLIGKDEHWTDWTPNSIVSYVGLPSGQYQLAARGKDAFGNITELEPVAFEVVPPYWEQSWFYGAQILLFSTLLMLSYRLNRKKLKYQVVSQVLTIFTLILIVEFVQVTLEAQVNIEKTPVTNFAIQAGIALLVFPLERLLSYIIRQEHVRKKKDLVQKENDTTEQKEE